jgi:hypothetical protein
MPLQNRVAPDGSLHAVKELGLMLGNRGGKFHRDDKTLGKRRWASTHWIACELHYKDWHHEAMGQGYTSLFFLDEVTALSAGHRPCFMCRRKDAKAFLGDEKVTEFDHRLHAERISSSSREAWGSTPPAFAEGYGALKKGGGGVSTNSDGEGYGNKLIDPLGLRPLPHAKRGEEVPDGAMMQWEGQFLAKRGQHLLHWSFSGYTGVEKIIAGMQAKILTPPSIVAILARGYKPRWHPSANQWENT